MTDTFANADDALMMTPTLEAMAERLLTHASPERRTLVAIAGPPAAGKSTLTQRLCERLNVLQPGVAAIVPMDGYHFDNAVLAPQGRLDIKGAPETFDVAGLLSDLTRLRRDDGAVAVPVFDRPLDLARAGGRLILPEHRLVLVEGNYLLLDAPPWRELQALFDLSVFIDVPDSVLVERLLCRWRDMGQDPAGARARTHDKDMLNARLVNDRSAAPDWRWQFYAAIRHSLGPKESSHD
ncbi:nucleoside triphosphate hydrolase [Chromohalobacter israelensis]|uniref:nucleoside triphosphate hydrolase n=1 Tax=Chromohalobacter israelensis TaxID=141390 RepID=UPI000D709853|nr:nucleoside triphosphate hydrolase [Chromohalobacter salexigens]PWW36230.1 pantothenate kinase [Chromohalobacter salexigens]